MTEKALALRLAEELEWQTHWKPHAAELRRLHEVEQQRNELLEALRQIAKISNQPYGTDYEEIDEAREIARAAIAKAEGEK